MIYLISTIDPFIKMYTIVTQTIDLYRKYNLIRYPNLIYNLLLIKHLRNSINNKNAKIMYGYHNLNVKVNN